jgi:hypothetical protein
MNTKINSQEKMKRTHKSENYDGFDETPQAVQRSRTGKVAFWPQAARHVARIFSTLSGMMTFFKFSANVFSAGGWIKFKLSPKIPELRRVGRMIVQMTRKRA